MSILEVISPADGTVAGTAPILEAADVEGRAAELRAAQGAWEQMGVEGRVRRLATYRDWILDNATHLTDLLQLETGKVRHEAALEPSLVADLINYFSKIGASALASEVKKPHGPLGAAKKLHVGYRPYPLVGVITPWNFPLLTPFMDGAPALVAGAAVIVKPSEVTPLAFAEAVRGWQEIGAPDVLACVTGEGATGAALVDTVDYVQFTGSTPTGRRIAVRAAERLIPCSLELGGKDAMIVLADADLDRAANGAAWGGLLNSGQVCVSVERVYVEAPAYDEFVTKLVARVEGLRQGPGELGQSDVGAMATDAQVGLVQRHVDEAVAAGAKALTGGRASGRYFEPTVLVDVDHSMSCLTEETFGPTIPVMKVDDAEEAIRLTNDSPYGLSASVWTRDLDNAAAIAARLDVGAVNVNDVIANLFSFTLPHGGWKDSGIGARFGGEAAIRKYCRAKAVTEPRIAPKNELMWYPYTKFRVAPLQWMLRALVARDARRRLGRNTSAQ